MSKSKRDSASVSMRGQNVIGTINATGGATVRVDQRVIHQATPELEELFKSVHEKVQARPEAPGEDKAKLEKQVKQIERESARGEAADQDKLEGWLRKLAKMAPDILDVMAASLAGPAAGFTMVFKKIVERAKAETAGG